MGDNVESAKLDMIEQMKFFIKTAAEDKHDYPKFLDGDFKIVYKFNTESLLEYYSGILSLSGLEKKQAYTKNNCGVICMEDQSHAKHK